MTIQQALAEGTQLLNSPSESAFIDTPALDASILLRHALGISKTELVLRANECIDEAAKVKYKALLERRRSGECIAYITGCKEFRGLEFIVNPNVLVPRPDTETLVEAAIEYIDGILSNQSIKAKDHDPAIAVSLLDLCTGQGAVAISLKNERPFLNITATDISPQALETAMLNAERLLALKLSEKRKSSSSHFLSFIQSDLFKDVQGKFNIIVSNPPYIRFCELSFLSPEVRLEPALALDGGEDGLTLIRKIIAESPKYLVPGGVLLLEATHGQMPEIWELLANHGFSGIRCHKDIANRDRVISGQKLGA